MKKTLALLVITIMALAAVMPLAASVRPTAIDEVYPGGATPGDAESDCVITYPQGGQVEPAKILAIWETPLVGQDDDLYKPGAQINPPMIFEDFSCVWIYVAFEDPDGDIQYNTQIKIDISWPDNGYGTRLGDGTKKEDNVEPVLDATWEEFYNASLVDGGSNANYICYYNGANDGGLLDGYEYVEDSKDQGHLKVKKAMHCLYYHDPAGWYDADVTLQGTFTDNAVNYFEYVLGIGVEIDFSLINWGNEQALYQWHRADGNWFFDEDGTAEDPDMPTIRSIGNWDSELAAHFTSGPQFVDNDVLFDIRVGDHDSMSDQYNMSYCEVYSPQHNPIYPDLIGMYPCNYYGPLPIDNYDITGDVMFNDVLLKCHEAKLDFYIFVIEWTQGNGVYPFEFHLRVNAPGHLPVERDPCSGSGE